MRKIFFDHISTTPTDQRVVEEMLPYLTSQFGNPSSLFYEYGQKAASALEEARNRVAGLIGAEPHNIIFTSGATEATNMALKGIAWANEDKGRHIILSDIEHFSVLFAAQALTRWGFEITKVPVDRGGIIDLAALKASIRADTILISIMHANNEIGTIEPITEIANIAKEKGIFFHTDAVAAAGIIPVDVKELGVDALTLAGHSLYGPKGIGALYLKQGVKIEPLLQGGFQEAGYRSGTENLPGAVGFGVAAQLAKEEMPQRMEHLLSLRAQLWEGLTQKIRNIHFTGHSTQRLPGHVSFWVENAEGESLLLHLVFKGIAVASGSACSSNIQGKTEEDLAASHVLTAIGVPSHICTGSLAISLGKDNNSEEVDYFLEIFPGIVDQLRAMSPWQGDIH
jgi:cysteine desulfurase